mgnify:CR=1 FL=1
MKELYAEHVTKIRTVFSEDVAKQLGVRNLQPKAIKQLLRSIKDILPTHMLHSLSDNLKHNIDLNINTYLSYESLIAYLILLRNPRLRDSPIAIDSTTGTIIVFYNKDVFDRDSTKISIQCNSSSEYVYSIIDREGGLALFRGKLKLQEGAHHKIEKLMDMFA